VWALGVVSFLVDVHSETILALLPHFVGTTLAAGALGIGLMEGSANLVAAAMKVWAGRRSDVSGRRKPWVLGGYAVSTAAKGVWALATGAVSAIAIRVADRVGKGLRTAPRDAMIADVVPAEARGAAYGVHRMMDTAGAIVGAGLAWLLLEVGLATRSVLAWAALPGVLAVVFLAVAVRERARGPLPAAKPDAAPPPTPNGPRVLLVPFLAVEGLFGVVFASYAFFLLRAERLGVAPQTLPLLYLGFNVVYALVPWPLGRAADRFGRLRVLALGFVAFAVACALASAAQGLDAALLGSLAAFGVASAVVESVPRAVVAEALGARGRGTALGLHFGVTGGAAVLSGLAFGFLWESVGPATLFLSAAGVAVACAAALRLTYRRT
jgi:MFS family permease